ncbi:hypothetical protein IFM89_008313 [Coptis chinensis]|uniref:Transposase MuDR plant domain-containing protein n=1 Tax=Coptis chinensis TaxID=261450 RepID=A0A835M7F1_9MAGN|nr:hypothetical protein IFM89_008313 [Coptis chinensis]
MQFTSDESLLYSVVLSGKNGVVLPLLCTEIKMRALMVLFDKKDLIIYIGGSFKPPLDAKEVCHSHYESEWDSLMMREVDGDELNMMDFTKDILKLVQVAVGLQLSYITNGKLVYVNTDGELLQMWGLLAPSKDGFCRIYPDLDLGGVDDFLVMTRRISTPTPNGLSQLSQAEEGDDITLLEIKRRGCEESVIIDEEEENFWAELARLKATGFEDELDDDLERERVPLVVPANPSVQVGTAIIIDEMEMPRTEVVELKLGMEWPTITALRHNIRTICIQNRFEVFLVKDESYRIRALCKCIGCPWLAYWRRKDDGFTMKLKTLFNVHTCSADTDHKNSMADANWVSRVMEDHMKVHYKSTTPRNIIDEVRQKYHVAISYWTAWHARIKCLTQIHGDYGESYNLVSVLCDQDPNNYVFPPPYVRGIGRPKKNRRRDEDEGLKPNKKKRKCSKCKVEGHNAKTCKGLAAEKNGRAKGKKKDRQAAPSQASATQVAAPSQASTTQVAAPSQASTNQVAAPSQATKLLASTSTGKKPMTRGKVAATTEASASVTQSKSSEDKELDNPKRGPHHRHTFRDFLEKQKTENNKTSKGLITADKVTTFKPPPPPKRNIQAIGGFGQSHGDIQANIATSSYLAYRQKFKVIKDHGK